ncbi:MAG TPA: phosphotransferase [Acidimicrobiales bacterium]|nr:phosphotransferase [Acidimicrobiales bacterium]
MDLDSVPGRRFAAVAARVEPGARLVGLGTFAGGLSAQMTVLELETPGGGARRLVVRSLSDSGSAWRSLSIGDEFSLLVSLADRGLPVPVPRLYDDSATILDQPYAVLDYADGSPRVESADPAGTGRAFAAQLAAIHDVDGSVSAVLPRRTDQFGRWLAHRPDRLDDAVAEGFLRDILGPRWPPPEPDRTALLHGDFWAGNLLWRDDEIVCVIDWEEASVGDPLADVATTRLDLLWAFGPAAMSAFTDHYLSVTALAADTLPLWDLAAALRPAGVFSRWVADWIDFGRPDMEEVTMRADHAWFLDQAVSALDPTR